MPTRSRPGRIAILAPMPSELAPIVRLLSLRRSQVGDTVMHVGSVGDIEILATRTGIGTALAARTAERVINATAVDHVMVVGTAGGVGVSRVGDIVVPSAVVDQATGSQFRASPFGDALASGTIVTSDEFIIEPAALTALAGGGVVALDMETAAVAAVCQAREVPWSAVRVISDRADDHPDDSVLGLAHPDGSPNILAALRFMLTHPRRIPQLTRLARDAKTAAQAAATAAATQIGDSRH